MADLQCISIPVFNAGGRRLMSQLGMLADNSEEEL